MDRQDGEEGTDTREASHPCSGFTRVKRLLAMGGDEAQFKAQ